MILALTVTQLACGLLLASLLMHRREVGGRLLQLLGAISSLLLLPWAFTDLLAAPAGRLLLAASLVALLWFLILPRIGDVLALVLRIQWFFLILAALAVARTIVDEASLLRLVHSLTLGLAIAVLVPFTDLLLHPAEAFRAGTRAFRASATSFSCLPRSLRTACKASSILKDRRLTFLKSSALAEVTVIFFKKGKSKRNG